jgi:hypothetical protein
LKQGCRASRGVLADDRSSDYMEVMNTIAEVLKDSIAFNYRCIDRLILNAYIPTLQTPGAMAGFMRQVRGKPILGGLVFKELTDQFVARIKSFAAEEKVVIVHVTGRQKPGEAGTALLAEATRQGRFGVVGIVSHQESSRVFVSTHLGGRATNFGVKEDRRLVNHYYFYIRDENYGEGFVRFSSYPPFQTRIWLNGHGYVAGELKRRGIAFKTADNLFVEAGDAKALQEIADGFTAQAVEKIARGWLTMLPDPLSTKEREAGYGTSLSIYQAEFCDNLIFHDTRALNRVYEQVLRDHLHVGRPDLVKIVFDRRITKRTPGRFSTRVLRGGTVSCLKTFYRRSFLKQYNKGGRALRTELCVNDPSDLGSKKSLVHLGHLGCIANHAIGRFLKAQAAAYAPALSRSTFERIVTPSEKEGKRVAAVRFGTTWAMQLLMALACAGLSFRAFTNRDVRRLLTERLGVDGHEARATRIGYELRKLIGKGVLRKVPGRSRYTLTDSGYRVVLFLVKLHERLLTPGLDALDESARACMEGSTHGLDCALNKLNAQFDDLAEECGMKMAA